MGAGKVANMSADCENDYKTLIKPYAVAGGIYDFSGQANHVCYEEGVSVTKEEIAECVRMWWDGSSEGWSTNDEFQASRKDDSNPFKLVIGGEEYRIMNRQAFGDNDQQHVVLGRSKDKSKKSGCVMAHSDYTVTVGIYDEEFNQKEGALNGKVQELMTAYKGTGF